jgi:putative DNA primase/helicase
VNLKDEPGRKRDRQNETQTQEARPPEYSDESLALLFAAKYSDRLRYVKGWNRWLIWDVTRWKADETLRAYDLSRAICRQASVEARKRINDKSAERIARAIASARTVASVELLARSDRQIAATHDQWDSDSWRLNTPAGVIGLQTGNLSQHQPEECMTKMTAVAPELRRKDCPLWRSFLLRVFGNDQELISFVRRVAGYCLSGSVRDHALFFAYGTGANGKSVFCNTLRSVLGDYATSAPMETFMASNTDRHPTELADLRGARLVTSVETEEGRRWAESRIKQMTGGDPIKARLMRQDFFEYVPQFKLLMVGNHKPALRGVDEAIRRRFHLIPFIVKIPPEERDPQLPEKLMVEWPAILRWAIEGCLEWQSIGLSPPEIVRAATDEYLAEEDTVGRWIAECCIQEASATSTSAALFESWKSWAEASGEYVGSLKRLVQTLEDRGFERWRDPKGRKGFRGLEPRS